MINDIKDDKVTIKFNINMIIVGALSILVFVSVIQTVTLANLVGKNQPVLMIVKQPITEIPLFRRP